MNKLILCEGETDAILLSYYLERPQDGIIVPNRPKICLFRLPRRMRL